VQLSPVATPQAPGAARGPRPGPPRPSPGELAPRSVPPPHLTTEAPERRPIAERTQVEAAFAEGWQRLGADDFAGATAAFERAVVLEPTSAIAEDARYWLAVALVRGKHDQEAKSALTDFLERHPGSPRAGEAALMLGWILYDAHDASGARKNFEAAARSRSPRVQAAAQDGLHALE
jgi:TolA-binding protein